MKTNYLLLILSLLLAACGSEETASVITEEPIAIAVEDSAEAADTNEEVAEVPTEAIPTKAPAEVEVNEASLPEDAPPEGGPPEGGPPEGGPPEGGPDLAAAAESLGVSEQELRDAIGDGPPDFSAVAEALDIPVAAVEGALARSGGGPPGGGPPGNSSESVAREANPNSADLVHHELLDELFFNADALVSYEKVACTLEDGSISLCYEMVFDGNLNGVVQGPYCPETIDNAVSLTVYDGPTNPGFQAVTRPLFEAMEADGFDVVEDDGTVHRYDSEQNSEWDYCLGPGTQSEEVQVTYHIPAVPVLATTNRTVSLTDFDLFGLSLNGIPIAGDPPSIYDGPGRNIPGGNIPSLDACGGHPDPGGYYHLHLISETINKVLDTFGITEVECAAIEQAIGTELVGFGIDGFPIYAYDEEPSDLDECRGRTAITPEHPEGTYHYVASNVLAPNAPDCLKGLAAESFFTYE